MLLIEVASAALTEEFGKGFSYTNIANYKRFYLTFNDLQILQTVSEEFNNPIQQALPAESSAPPKERKAVPDLFYFIFSYNYPFIYKTITFSCIRFAISDIYAYLCRC